MSTNCLRIFPKFMQIILSEVELACKSETDGYTYYMMSVRNTQIR